nr:biogenesis of lysosome-related organelles complex 1 subunit 2 isoform X2 [Ictidomys tridecemlineatus]
MTGLLCSRRDDAAVETAEEAKEPAEADITELCRDMFSKMATYLTGELTDAGLQPYLDQINVIEEQVAALEQAAYKLDAYSKKLGNHFYFCFDLIRSISYQFALN